MVTINTLNGGNITVTTGSATPARDPSKTWVKRGADAAWEAVTISETSIYGNPEYDTPTTQISNVDEVTAIEIGNNITSIGYVAFMGCGQLTEVTMPSSVESIVDYAFGGCSGLTSVTIGSGVTSIGRDAFSDCSGLTSVIFQGKTLEQVQNIEDGNGNKQYPWGITNTSIISVA